MENYKPNISGFADFCEYHANGEPIFIVNGKLRNGFDLLVDATHKYCFWFDCCAEIERAINENLYMFDIKETDNFYYPNDNMFSGSNSIKGIKGYVLTLKRKYGRKYIYDIDGGVVRWK